MQSKAEANAKGNVCVLQELFCEPYLSTFNFGMMLAKGSYQNRYRLF